MQPTRLNRSAMLCPLMVLLTTMTALAPVNVFAQTLSRIQSSGVISIGFVPDQPPFSFLSADSKPLGYAVELCTVVTDALKAQPAFAGMTVKYVPVTAANGLRMVELGQVDLLCGAIAETRKTRGQVSFSIPIFITGIGALVRRDASPTLLRVLNGEVSREGPTWRATVNAGLATHIYVVHAGTTSETWVRERIAQLGVIAKVVSVQTREEGVEMIEQGKADAFFANRTALAIQVAQHPDGGDLLVLDRRFTLEPVALALRRGDEDFRLAVDTVLSGLYRSDDHVRVYSRYFGEPSDAARMLFQAYALP